MSDNQILEQLRDLAHTVVPKDGLTILFGSRARGTSRSDSDWDILIILDKNKITPEDYNNVAFPFDQIGWNMNVDINPIIYTKKNWELSSHTPFYKNVTKEGIVL